MQLRPPQAVPLRESNRRAWLLLGFALVAGALVLSFLPPHTKFQLHTKGRLHYAGHFLVFGAVGFALLRAARSNGERLAALALALGFGPLIEFAEHRHYGFSIEWPDVLVDFLAVIVAAAIALPPSDGGSLDRSREI